MILSDNKTKLFLNQIKSNKGKNNLQNDMDDVKHFGGQVTSYSNLPTANLANKDTQIYVKNDKKYYVSTGSAWEAVSSDASKLNGQLPSHYLNRANHTGDSPSFTMSTNAHISMSSIPTNDNHLTNKKYVDAFSGGLKVKDPVKLATTAPIDLSSTISTVDGKTVAVNDRILVKDQANQAENGLYKVNSSFTLTRTSDADTPTNIVNGMFVVVKDGDTNKGFGFALVLDVATVVVGTTPLNFIQFSSPVNVSAGTGLTLSANEMSIDDTWAGQTSITTLGTVTEGTWNADVIDVEYGGTGVSTFTAGYVKSSGGTDALTTSGTIPLTDIDEIDLITIPPTDGQVLTYNETDGTWVPSDVSSSSSGLEDRVEDLEAQTSTLVKTARDDFDNMNLIAAEYNKIVVEEGYVRADRIIDIEENNFQEMDAHTDTDNIIYTPSGFIEINNKNQEGVFYSKEYPVSSVSAVTVAADFEHDSVSGYNDEQIFQVTNTSDNIVNLSSLIYKDNIVSYSKIKNRVASSESETFHVYQDAATGYVSLIITDKDNKVVLGETNITPNFITEPLVMDLEDSDKSNHKQINLQRDDDGNVFVSFSFGFGQSTAVTNLRFFTLKLKWEAGNLHYYNSDGTTTNTSRPAFDTHKPPLGSQTRSFDTLLIRDKLHIVYTTGYNGNCVYYRSINKNNNTAVTRTATPIHNVRANSKVCLVNNTTSSEIGIFLIGHNNGKILAARCGYDGTFKNINSPAGTKFVALQSSASTDITNVLPVGGVVVSSSGEYFLFYVQKSGTNPIQYLLRKSRIGATFTNSNRLLTNPSTGNSPVISNFKEPTTFSLGDWDSAFIKKDNSVHAIIPVNQGSGRYFSYFKTNLDMNNSWDFNDEKITSSSSFMPQAIDNGSTISVVFTKNEKDVYEVVLGPDSTKIVMKVRSNVMGGWETVYDNTNPNNIIDNRMGHTPSPTIDLEDGNSVQVLIKMNSSTSKPNTPTFKSYQIGVIENTTNEVIGTFKSKPLINDRVIKKVKISAVIDSGGYDNVFFKVSNDGGANWKGRDDYPSNSELLDWIPIDAGGNDITFNTFGTDLRVWWRIVVPANESSTRIHSYSVITTNVATQNEITDIQINMMKLGLQINALKTLNRTSYKNMMINLFDIATGITLEDTTLSSGTITVLSGKPHGLVTSEQEDTDNNIFPSSIIVVGDKNTGNVEYSVKRNNGDWEQAQVNQIHKFTTGASQTANKVQIRAKLYSGAQLLGWAYVYS